MLGGAGPVLSDLLSSPVHVIDRHGYHHRLMSNAVEVGMRTTVALDADLVAEAQRLTGTREKSALLRQALQALIERESARRLARLAGSEPDLAAPRRRRDSER